MVIKEHNIKPMDYPNYVRHLYARGENSGECCRSITFQITGECNLRCSYCYEHNKYNQVMSLDTGKAFIDRLLDMYERNDSDFINHNTKGLVLDFIGGEPLLEAELIEKICDYYFHQCYTREIPFGPFTKIAFATNGQLWFSEPAQHLIKKYHDIMSITVSIDGIKELHDKYRVDKFGAGSFDKAIEAFLDGKKYGWHNSKMTYVPESFSYLFESVKFMISEGCRDIYVN